MDNDSFTSIYQPLPRTGMTRILCLDPSAKGDQLAGRLEYIDLERPSQYEALSYVWGDNDKEHIIQIEGRSIAITFSLFSALKDLRHESQNRRIWADAICINQNDLEEREQQVSIMGTIYRAASRVVTYIGPESEDSSAAIQFGRELIKFHILNPVKDPRLHLPNEVHHIGLPPISDPRWQALKSLLLRGWSGRSWCAHEFVMNKTLLIMCGKVEVRPWAFLVDIVCLVVNRDLPVFLVPTDEEDSNCLRECLRAIGRLRLFVAGTDRKVPLLSLLIASHPLKASDPRDKIYSLLGLAQDRETYAVPVDYTCSAESLYTLVGGRIISISKSTDLLYSNITKKSMQLPSWVPDWSTWQFGSDGSSYYFDYIACGDTSPNVEVDGDRLHLTGSLIDKVSWIDDTNIGAFYSYPLVPGRDAWLVEMMKVAQQSEQYNHEKSDVLWRTLIGNITLEGKRATDVYWSHYYAHFTLTEESPLEQQTLAREYCDAARRRSRYRRLCATETGYFGAIPETAQVGDWICMLEGSRLLFTLRQKGGHFLLVGPAYTHGLMHDEALQLDSYKRRVFTLV